MKKHLAILSILALGVFAASCDKTKEAQPVAITIQLTNDGENFATEGVKVSLADAAASYTLEVSTDANGVAAFVVKPGAYTAQATYVISKNGQRLSYNGSNSNIVVGETTTQPFILPLQEVVSQQIVIKELYTTGCPSNDGTKSTTDDAYVILYNNSEIEADASNVVFGFIAPYNAHGSNKYRNAGRASSAMPRVMLELAGSRCARYFYPFPQRKAEGSSNWKDAALIRRSSSFESRVLYPKPGHAGQPATLCDYKGRSRHVHKREHHLVPGKEGALRGLWHSLLPTLCSPRRPRGRRA